MSNIIIWGTGYVGHPLAESLSLRGHTVTGVSRTPRQNRLYKHTCLNLAVDAPLYENFDTHIYLISSDGRTEEAYERAYIINLQKVLESINANTLQRFIFISSTSVYGGSEFFQDELSTPSPSDFRGQTLLRAESLALQYMKDKATIIRLSGIYGPNRLRFLKKIREQDTHTSHPWYTNHIHLEDCIGLISYIVEMQQVSSLYVGTDSEPSRGDDILLWLHQELGLPFNTLIESHKNFESKRLSNKKIIQSGYTFYFPTFREGYRSLF